MIAVMGVLKTKNGLIIKDKITKYLKDRFKILYIEQDPPGKLFEYPAINYALKTAIELNEPVLYIHTKGAANPHNSWYQTPAKQIWEKEFGTEKVIQNFELANTEIPTIVCPLIGPNNETWFNAKIINPAAAKIILETFHYDSDRYFYEWKMQDDKRIKCIGTFYSKPIEASRKNKNIQLTWDNTIKNLTKDLPKIDY